MFCAAFKAFNVVTFTLLQGYLYWRGALLKAKTRGGFNHQLQYYETREDFQCKRTIDLSEVSDQTLNIENEITT